MILLKLVEARLCPAKLPKVAEAKHALLLLPLAVCSLLLLWLTVPLHCNSSYSLTLCGEKCKEYSDCELVSHYSTAGELVRSQGKYLCIANQGIYYRELEVNRIRLCLIGVTLAVYLGIMVYGNSKAEGEYDVLVTKL